MNKSLVIQQMEQLKKTINKYYLNKELHNAMMLKYRELQQQLNR